MSAIRGSVPDEWRHFFESLKEDRGKGTRSARTEPSWGTDLGELQAITTHNPELVAALTGDLGETERSVREGLQQRAHRAGSTCRPPRRCARSRIAFAPS